MRLALCRLYSSMFVMFLGSIILWATHAQAATEMVLHEFSAQQHGALPFGLISDSRGNLFGATTYGGEYNLGTIFEFSPNADGGWTQTVLHSFTGGSDGGPSNPAVDSAGNVYGVGSGAYGGCNCVYKWARNTNGIWIETVIYTFQTSQGYTNGVLVADDAGK